MKEFTIPMALVDYIPVILFLLGTNLFAKDFKHAMSKLTYCLFRIGTLMVLLSILSFEPDIAIDFEKELNSLSHLITTSNVELVEDRFPTSNAKY